LEVICSQARITDYQWRHTSHQQQSGSNVCPGVVGVFFGI